MERQETIPWAKPEFWGDEERYVVEALSSHWISVGPFVTRFESEFAEYNQIAHAVSTSNGTTALHLAYLALSVKPGDEIIVPGFAFMAAANVAIHMNAVAVFADVDQHTWSITAAAIESRLSPNTKAIVPVHTYGNVCEMDDIISLAESRGIAVIEDAAESFGSSYRGQLAGTFGTMGTFSLHAAKTITTGEGGMVVTHSDAVKERLLLYRSHGMNGHHYWHDVVGHNFRLGNLQAALGCAQLMHINQIVSLRKQMFGTYKKHLSEVPGVVMQRFPPEVNPVPWVVAVKLDPRAYPQGRDKVMADMTAAGIETRPGFYSPGRMRHLYQYSPLSVADDVSEWTLALPSFPSLTEEQIHTICSELKKNRH